MRDYRIERMDGGIRLHQTVALKSSKWWQRLTMKAGSRGPRSRAPRTLQALADATVARYGKGHPKVEPAPELIAERPAASLPSDE
jgi:hypothetical protein